VHTGTVASVTDSVRHSVCHVFNYLGEVNDASLHSAQLNITICKLTWKNNVFPRRKPSNYSELAFPSKDAKFSTYTPDRDVQKLSA